MRFAYSADSSATETRFRPRAEIDMAVADRFGEAIITALTDGSHRVVVDLTDVTFLDSSGIRALLMAYRFAAERDRSLTIGGVLDLLTEKT